MEQIGWIIWLIFAVCLIVAEAFTLGFFLLWFGVGALAAALVAFLGLGIGWQFAAFTVVSAGLTAMSRTIFAKYLVHDESSSVKMGMERLPGEVGTVVHGSSGTLNEGSVRVFGSVWTAMPADGETALEEGERVEVVRVKGSTLYVKRISNELPEWRRSS